MIIKKLNNHSCREVSEVANKIKCCDKDKSRRATRNIGSLYKETDIEANLSKD